MGYPYSDQLMSHFMHPRHAGVLPDATGCAEVKNNTCGDRTRVYIRVVDGVVVAATFLGTGCGPGIACADYLLEHCIGKTVSETEAVSADSIRRVLDLPKQKLHAAELAVAALAAALRDHDSRTARRAETR